MKPFFNVGEVVRIKDLHMLSKGVYVPFGIHVAMYDYKDCIARIEHIVPDRYDVERFEGFVDGCQYYLNIGKDWRWSSPMLEKVGTEQETKENKEEIIYFI